MRLLPSDPDIQTIVQRIRDDDLDLQPEFQRGEVWSLSKKQRLVDSILRDWHIPPIHVVEVKASGKEEVLDGQQRLVAIRDFVDGAFAINGSIEPASDEVAKLNGLRYAQLPPLHRRRFDKFTIRFFRIVDYSPQEPGELFFRLNQAATLTTAEQRNAFYGPARAQIRTLLDAFNEGGGTPQLIGFSNARMAYDDVFARFCFTLEVKSLAEKVTARAIDSKYRSADGFGSATVEWARRSTDYFTSVLRHAGQSHRLNKATLYSWLCFYASCQCPSVGATDSFAAQFFSWFETERQEARAENHPSSLMALFNDRASSRVADVSSVLIRDLVLWRYFSAMAEKNGLVLNRKHPRLSKLAAGDRLLAVDGNTSLEANLVAFAMELRWGDLS